MFCPMCGTQNPDNANVCGVCGARLNQSQQNPVPTSYTPVDYPSYAPPSVSKKEYMATMASEGTRSKRKLVLLTMLICIALIIGGVFATLTMPFYEIPVLAFILDLADESADELEEELERTVEEIEDNMDAREDVLSRDELKASEKLLDGMKDLEDSFSVLKTMNMVNLVKEVVEEYPEAFEGDDADEIQEIFDGVSYVMLGVIIAISAFFFLPMLFTILGGCLRSTGLTVTAIVLTAIAQLVLCGVIWVALTLVVGIVQAYLCSRINKEYNDYCMGKPVAY